jgi:hypothetical protein
VDSIKKFSFSGNSGNVNKNGNLSGKGILRIDDDSPEQNFCIQVKSLFGLQIASIESDFVDGLANQKTFIELKNGVKNEATSMKAEVVVSFGRPHGLFRVEADIWWSLGTLVQGQLNGPCWIVYSNFVSLLMR